MNNTALEWLESRISVLIPEDIGSQLMFKSNIAKAKEMEKEQIMDAYYYEPNCNDIKDDGEKYYKEIFNK